jgi:hypothetical protein
MFAVAALDFVLGMQRKSYLSLTRCKEVLSNVCAEFWGAQAASLFFSAACRKSSSIIVVGKLPTTAGWQPALPRP